MFSISFKKLTKFQKATFLLGLIALLVVVVLIVRRVQTPKFSFEEINNNIYEERGAELFDALIGSKENKSRITFKVDGVGISYELPFEQPEWSKNEDGSVQSNTGKVFRYDFIEKEDRAIGLKTELVLKSKPPHNVFTFPLKLEGTKRTRRISSRKFYDKNDNELFHFKKPVMVDDDKEKSEDFDLRITKSQIALVPDKEWLNAQERIYPVTIDMSLELATSVLSRSTD